MLFNFFSALSWTNDYNKQTSSYGNSLGHSECWWREFIRKCHVVRVANKDFRSIIKQSQHYSIQGIVCKTEHGQSVLDKQEQLLLPVMSSTSDEHSSSGNTSLAHHSKCSSSSKDVAKLERKGKGTHGLTIVRRMLENQENWQTISKKSAYQFSRVFEKPSMQAIYYTPDMQRATSSMKLALFMG